MRVPQWPQYRRVNVAMKLTAMIWPKTTSAAAKKHMGEKSRISASDPVARCRQLPSRR